MLPIFARGKDTFHSWPARANTRRPHVSCPRLALHVGQLRRGHRGDFGERRGDQAEPLHVLAQEILALTLQEVSCGRNKGSTTEASASRRARSFDARSHAASACPSSRTTQRHDPRKQEGRRGPTYPSGISVRPHRESGAVPMPFCMTTFTTTLLQALGSARCLPCIPLFTHSQRSVWARSMAVDHSRLATSGWPLGAVLIGK